MSSQIRQAQEFRALHAKGGLFVVPNAWDAGSARLMEDCGAAAIATSSAAVAWAMGYPDGEAITADMLLETVKAIVRVVRVPVSVDSEAGYSPDPQAVAGYVGRLIDAGAVGMNIEDGTSPPDLLARKIEAIRTYVASRDADFFINARADTFLRSLVAPEDAVADAIARGRRYRDAGADGLFVPAILDLNGIREIAEAVNLPLNVLIWKGLPIAEQLRSAGVRRLSAGAGIGRAALGAARRAAKQLLQEGPYDTLYHEAEGCPNMNALLAPR